MKMRSGNSKKHLTGIGFLFILALLLGGCGKAAASDGSAVNAQPAAETEQIEMEPAAIEEPQADATQETEPLLEEMDEEIPADVPNSFVEEQAGKTEFSSYEEVIHYLEDGQAYAYVTLTGYEGDVLLIADQTYEIDGTTSTIIADVYLNIDGRVRHASAIGSDGTAYPIRYADNVLYTAGNHDVCSYFISEENQSIMVKDSIIESFDENGTATYIGFLRQQNDFDHDEEVDTDSDQIFMEKMEEYSAAPILTFTVVKQEG